MAFFRGEEGTAHGDTARKYVGSLLSGTGTADILYTAASGDETANILSDITTTEDPADAKFSLFLDTSSNKKIAFNGIVTGASLTSTVGDISTVSISFQMSGPVDAFDL